jgi:hypothetical protein
MQENSFVQKNNNGRNDKNDRVVFTNQAIKAPTIVVIDEDKNNL